MNRGAAAGASRPPFDRRSAPSQGRSIPHDDNSIPHDDSNVDVAALERDLKAVVRGEVRADTGYRAMYSTDASNYRQIPLAVVLPRDEADVIKAMEVCRKHDVPVLSRGGGTSLAGETCNIAVVFDYTKYMNAILEINYEEKYAWVQPGCVLDDLRNEAEKRHMTFGPDPATHNRNTIGGMIGNNSCGMHAQMAGKVEENIEALDILTYDGERITVGPTSEEELDEIIRRGGRRGEIYSELKRIRDKYADLVRERFPDIPRRVSGFSLNELLPENGFNVARALVGTEGTCVVVLRAKCRLVHSPPHKAVAVLGFEEIAEAGSFVPFCNTFDPIALEGMDETLFQYMHEKGQTPYDKDVLFPDGHAWLLVQFGGDTKEEAVLRAQRLVLAAKGPRFSIMGDKLLDDEQQMEELWKLRESGLGTTSKIPGEPDFYPGWEDSAVAPENLGDYLREFQAVMQRYGYYASLYGHFGQGCVHCSINFDLFTAEGIAKYRSFVEEMAHICVKYRGSLSGEHGDGQSRGELLPIMFGEELVQAFWEFKSAWDPQNRMNPGKVVKPHKLDEDLRWGVNYEPLDPPTHFSFREDRGSFAYAANRCVGAGACRKHDKGTMCPSYMVTRDEMHSTRGRARLLFEMLQQGPMKGAFANETVKESLDLCLACKGCKSECPVNVDMATYKSEFLAHYYEGKRRPLFTYLFGYMFVWAKLASRIPSIANFFTHAQPFATIAKALASMAPEREIPAFAGETFREWFSKREKTRAVRAHCHPEVSKDPERAQRVEGSKHSKVLLWVDTWNNYFFPQTAKAAVEVLEDAGFEVLIPPKNICCGRPLYDYGFLDQAKRQLCSILDDIREIVREGTPIIGLEPSCISVFKDEMQNLLPQDKDAERLSSQAFMLESFLDQKHSDYLPGKLHRKAVVHEHCHKKSLLETRVRTHIFDRMELDYNKLDSGCCGMAGAFGMEESHYDVSIKCGERVLLPKVREAPPEAIVVADGFSCREQIAQTTKRKAMHPVQVLKMAIDEKNSDASHTPYPEKQYVRDTDEEIARIVRNGYRILAGVLAVGVLAMAYVVRKR